ncbi:hypothetical protein AOLI_G00055100 [Acnodon oligacanthus]
MLNKAKLETGLSLIYESPEFKGCCGALALYQVLLRAVCEGKLRDGHRRLISHYSAWAPGYQYTNNSALSSPAVVGTLCPQLKRLQRSHRAANASETKRLSPAGKALCQVWRTVLASGAA